MLAGFHLAVVRSDNRITSEADIYIPPITTAGGFITRYCIPTRALGFHYRNNTRLASPPYYDKPSVGDTELPHPHSAAPPSAMIEKNPETNPINLFGCVSERSGSTGVTNQRLSVHQYYLEKAESRQQKLFPMVVEKGKGITKTKTR